MYMIKTENGYRPFLELNRPCPNSNQLEGVFRPQTMEQAQAETAVRAEAFCKLVESGDMYAIKSFNPPMTGAYGEKL